jgi:hypothetical protein
MHLVNAKLGAKYSICKLIRMKFHAKTFVPRAWNALGRFIFNTVASEDDLLECFNRVVRWVLKNRYSESPSVIF